MPLKHTWSTSIKNDAGASVTTDAPLILTGESETNFYVDVAPTSVVIVEVAVDVSNIVSGFLSSDKDLTVFTNDATGATGQVITLTANKAFAWNNTMTFTNPFTVDITAFYCDNDPGATLAKVRGGFLTNQV
jgi:hypothetical protein